MSKLIALVALLAVCSRAALLDKVLVEDKDALCLDGSYGVYYLYKGDPNKFIIYFEGGGWCGASSLDATLDSCYQRSNSDLGSSKAYPAQYTINDGILSNNSKNSFGHYTKLFFKYCDGSGHQGTKSAPVAYKGRNLYFRGSNLTISKLDHAEKNYGLFSKATEIMVTGGSAGGLAAFVWADYIRNRSAHAKVYSVPDSGIFLDSANFKTNKHEYRDMFMNLFKLSNTEINPPVPECVKAFPAEPYRCMLAENLHKFITTPLFPVQSLYDSWSLPNILGIACNKGRSLSPCTPDQLKYIQQYHQNTSRVMREIAANPRNGYWGPVCVDHVYMWGALYSPDYTIPMRSNNTIDQALLSWVANTKENHEYMDTGDWPSNQPCSGLSLATQ